MAPNRPAEELYDLQNDPYEINNLAGQPQHQTVQNELSDILDNWIDETKDQGRTIEEVQVTQAELEKMEKSHISTMSQRGFPPDVTPEDYLEYWKEQFNLR
jgi:uncharacterized sulfatase